MEIICANSLCAKRFAFRGGPAHFRRSKSHCCSRSCQNTTHGRDGTKQHGIWEGAKRRAKDNGVVFTLRIDDIPPIPHRCPVLGIAIVANSKAGPLDSSPSIDRINRSRGYVKGNVRIISNRANRLRSDGAAAELMLVARDAAELEVSHA